jgi:hypothetical protein
MTTVMATGVRAEAGERLQQRTEAERDDDGLDPLVRADPRERPAQHVEVPGRDRQVVDPDGVDHDPEDREEAEGRALGRREQRLADRHGVDDDRHDDGDAERGQRGDPRLDPQDAEQHEQRGQGEHGEDGAERQ